MAEAILSALLPVILDKLMSPAVRQIAAVFGTDEKLKKLKRIMERIQSVIVDAEDRQTADATIKSWISTLRDAIYEAEDILEDFEYKDQKKGRLKSRHKKVLSQFSPSNLILSRRLSGIIGKIEGIAEEIHKFSFQSNKETQICYRRPQTHSYVDEEMVLGREEDKEHIVRLLVNRDESKNLAVLPIVAMGGMGKTTLSQLVYRDHRVEDHFDLLMWVCVSDDFDVARLFRQIVESATKKSCELSNIELLQQEIRRLISGKKYLIVLDDVWNEKLDLWEQLETLLKCGGKGSAALVSTRSQKAAEMIVTSINTIYYLNKLPEEDSWELFRRRAFAPGDEEPADLVDIGKKIVNRCGGLPLAVKTLGSLMRFKKQKNEWMVVLNSDIWKMKVAQDDILPVLRLSYSYLSPQSKQCFAFCAIYPKDSTLKKETLIQLWMANGYIHTCGAIDSAMKGEEIYQELVWRSFFQNESEEYETVTCKMHDLMHDLAQSIMGTECSSMQKIEDLKDISMTARHLLIPAFIKSLHPDIHIPASTRTLLRTNLFPPKHCHGKDASECRSLRVLTWAPTEFPKHIIITKQLRHLRWLDMSYTNIKKLPEGICSLFNLQTLKLSNCKQLERLPENFVVLGNLRHLYIDGCSRLVCMPTKMGLLKQLRILTMYVVSDEPGSGIDQLCDLNLDGRLKICGIEKATTDAMNVIVPNILSKQNLHFLKLRWGAAGSLDVFEALKPNIGLTKLSINGYGQQFPKWMNDLQQLQNLVEISLENCTNCNELPPFGQLPFLKRLELLNMNEVKHIVSKTTCCNIELQSTLFPSLQALHLYYMKNLEDWSERSDNQALLGQKLLPCLSELYIYHSDKLKGMPNMPSLKFLHLNARNVSSTCPLERDVFRCIKSLKHLSINGYEKMRSLLENENETQSLNSSLQELVINNCDWMFSSPIGLWKNVASLQSLDIKNCKTLTSLPEEFLGMRFLKVLHLDSLSNLSVMFSSTSYAQKQGFSQLEELSLINCESLVQFPTYLTSLRTLDICKCDSLKTLQGLESFIELQSLCINDCDGLSFLPDGMEALTQLQVLQIINCNRLKSFPEGLQRRLPSLLSHEDLIQRFP